MKIAIIILLMLVPGAWGAFSQFVILTPDGNDIHKKHQPTIRQDSMTADTVIVRAPYIDDGMEYWICIANKPLGKKKLEFRKFLWKRETPKYIQSIIPLAKSYKRINSEKKHLGYAEFRIKKAMLNQVYIYHDYEQQILDGGYYYTFDLSKYKIEQGFSLDR